MKCPATQKAATLSLVLLFKNDFLLFVKGSVTWLLKDFMISSVTAVTAVCEN